MGVVQWGVVVIGSCPGIGIHPGESSPVGSRPGGVSSGGSCQVGSGGK